jgi:hypothetical protein
LSNEEKGMIMKILKKGEEEETKSMPHVPVKKRNQIFTRYNVKKQNY